MRSARWWCSPRSTLCCGSDDPYRHQHLEELLVLDLNVLLAFAVAVIGVLLVWLL